MPKLSKYLKKINKKKNPTVANLKFWDLAEVEKPAIKKKHNGVQRYHSRVTHFASQPYLHKGSWLWYATEY